MKKISILALLACLAAGFVHAQTANSDDMKISAGIGLDWMSYTNDQKFTYLSYSGEIKYTTSSYGIVAFLDLTKYFTLSVGYRFAADKAKQDVTFITTTSSNFDNTVTQFEIGGQLKYPFQLNDSFSLAPKAGLDYVGYIGGKVGSTDPNSDVKTILSPLMLTLGADLNFKLNQTMFIRVPLDLGIGLNSKLSDAYYSGGVYSSSSIIGIKIGAFFGYTF